MKRLIFVSLFSIALTTALVSQQFKQDWPRVMVVVDEKVDNVSTDVSALGSKLEEFFLEKGFRLVDKTQFAAVTARDIALAEGNPARAKEIGLRYGAELLIVGNAQTTLDAEKTFYGVTNFEYAAKGNARVLVTDTGELIAVSSQTGKKSAQGRTSAANLSLQVLGETIANDLYAKVRMKMKEAESGPRVIQVAFIGIDDKTVSDFERKLPDEIPILDRLKIRYLEADAAVYDAWVLGTIDDLRREITNREDLVVISFTGNRLDVSTKENVDRAKGSAFAVSPLDITNFNIENIFPSQVNYYAYNPLATIEVENGASSEIRNVKVSLFIPGFMTLPSEEIVPRIAPGANQSFTLSATLDARQLYALNANSSAQAKVELSYVFNNQPQTRSLVRPVTIYNRNTVSWRRGESVGSFITDTDDAVAAFSRYVIGNVGNNEDLQTKLPRNVKYAMAVWNGIRAVGINYVSDPWKSTENDILDQIQYPRETLASRTGDCDDSSVLLAACLENVGIRTKLIGTSDHIFIMFETEVKPKNGYMISMNEREYIIHEDYVWIPLETTMIREPFVKAWHMGAEEYYRTVEEGGRIDLIDTRQAKEQFPPANLPSGPRPSTPPADRVIQLTSRDLTDYEYHQSQLVSATVDELKANPDPQSKSLEAITYAKSGEYDTAVNTLSGIASPSAYNTLGNIFLLQNELPRAQEQYQKAMELDQNDGGVYLNFGLARYLAGSEEDAVEAFQAAVSKFNDPDQAYEILGLDKVKEALGMRAADAGEKKVAKSDLFALLNRSLKNLPSKQATTAQANRVRERYKNEQNRYVFGGRRGADPTQIASIKEFLYWKE